MLSLILLINSLNLSFSFFSSAMLHGMWDLSFLPPGTEAEFPVVEVQSLTTRLPRKSLNYFILNDTLVQVWRRGGDVCVPITNELFGILFWEEQLLSSNTLALKISNKTLYFMQKKTRGKKRSLVIQKNDPRKGGRKSHLKETQEALCRQ